MLALAGILAARASKLQLLSVQSSVKLNVFKNSFAATLSPHRRPSRHKNVLGKRESWHNRQHREWNNWDNKERFASNS